MTAFPITKIDLIYSNPHKIEDQPQVTNSAVVHYLFRKAWDMDKIELQEQFKIMLLNRQNRFLGIYDLATGGMSHCFVDLKLAFAAAITGKASNIILAHNHPSGSTTPSDADHRLTQEFAAAGKLLTLPVLDHLILTRYGYASFADRGLMP